MLNKTKQFKIAQLYEIFIFYHGEDSSSILIDENTIYSKEEWLYNLNVRKGQYIGSTCPIDRIDKTYY